jgi:uncharacterized repeat protein (TIGR03847 family)
LDAQRLQVEALGEPGQRRFRLLAVVDGETHVVWMEKQQLQALGLAIEQVLEQLPSRGPELDVASDPIEFDTQTRHQFRAGRLELGYDERRDRLVIIAHDIELESDAEELEPAFSCRFTRAQARELSADAAAVVAAGRPRCSMCGAPMGPGPHVCPQQNGHLPHEMGPAAEDDDEV